jgi:hypothetical protein
MSLTDSAIEILEDECVLSNSIIWPMIEEYYGSAGPKAWHETPYYPTSNAFIGETYAQLIVAFLHDMRAAIDPAQPVYEPALDGVVRRGAGCAFLSCSHPRETRGSCRCAGRVSEGCAI